jgi:hypothetical protein
MLPPVRYELWRQDDNGNRRDAAEQRLAELTRCPHKQTYWIAKRSLPEGEGE